MPIFAAVASLWTIVLFKSYQLCGFKRVLAVALLLHLLLCVPELLNYFIQHPLDHSARSRTAIVNLRYRFEFDIIADMKPVDNFQRQFGGQIFISTTCLIFETDYFKRIINSGFKHPTSDYSQLHLMQNHDL